jgi:thiol-disulfide isomerase/thioredoxin
LDDSTVTLRDLRGHVVIMEFWASWCGPCRMSTPSLDQIYRKYHDRGVSVLLVNAGERRETVERWVKQRFKAPVLLDHDGAVNQRYGVEGIPRLFVIDQAGDIIYDHSGYGGGLEHNLKLIIEELLDG